MCVWASMHECVCGGGVGGGVKKICLKVKLPFLKHSCFLCSYQENKILMTFFF